jgi:hypothetical protein
MFTYKKIKQVCTYLWLVEVGCCTSTEADRDNMAYGSSRGWKIVLKTEWTIILPKVLLLCNNRTKGFNATKQH